MSDKRVFVLVHPEARRRAMAAVADAGEGWRVEVSAPRRNGDQNAKFHAMCDDLAKSGVQWFGKRRTASEWKVLMVSGHAIATKEGSEIVPGIEGELVSIRESTALMSVKRSSSLIEYTAAFMAAHEVEA